jgi:hypothetical protein
MSEAFIERKASFNVVESEFDRTPPAVGNVSTFL